ncbi:hypothetical protein [Phytohabitans houttuyneae]|uniref:Gram-positive cocci surface proteins LPxTG domain-containing protein n=1 Tax=Phytohabitans houttuyneae TaxID=1076126 RepID=A0A6V8KSV8_9ACTN|nr:hypothetical protein [Phytohabitans houttuyneae]GFJ85421.1 hypothetical protein Phou_096010 [Phytohabitans houttuyneae]
MTRARASLAVLSALAVAALTAVAFPAPAQAAPLGSVRLSASKGTVDQTPIFATASAAKPCPSGFGQDAAVRIGPPGGPYQNVATPLRDGGYDKKAVSVKPNRSFARAIGGAPAAGEWWVVVECWSLTQGRHPDLFITPLTVTGKEWKLGQPASGASLDSPPPPRPTVPLTGPSGSAAPSTASPALADATTPPAVPDPELAANNRSGAASPLASALWVGGVVLVVAVVGAVALLTRRRRSN